MLILNKFHILSVYKLLFTGLYIGWQIIFNLHKIKKVKYIFINSDQFGHSVADSQLFIESYGHNSLVISIGTEFYTKINVERNKFFDKLLEANLIGIYIPKVLIDDSVWIYCTPLIRLIIRFIFTILKKNDCEIFENKTQFERNMYTNIINKYKLPLHEADKIVDSLDIKVFTKRSYYWPLGYLSHLIKSPSIDTSSLYRGLNGRSLKIIQSRLLGEDFVCLAIRRGDAPYHSKANYYFDAVDLINSMGFKVTLIGDRKYFFDLAKEKNYSIESKINNIDVTIREQKLFELFAIQNCKFIFGDQGGVWSLVSAFNRPGLMVNATPTSQLQYNVESLPRRWIYKSTGAEMLDVNKIFGKLFFRWKDESKVSTLFENQSNKNIELGKDDYLINVENDKEFIIEVLERYMKDAAYLIPNKMQESVKVNFPENNFLRLAENSSYSKEYISKLVGWATK